MKKANAFDGGSPLQQKSTAASESELGLYRVVRRGVDLASNQAHRSDISKEVYAHHVVQADTDPMIID